MPAALNLHPHQLLCLCLLKWKDYSSRTSAESHVSISAIVLSATRITKKISEPSQPELSMKSPLSRPNCPLLSRKNKHKDLLMSLFHLRAELLVPMTSPSCGKLWTHSRLGCERVFCSTIWLKHKARQIFPQHCCLLLQRTHCNTLYHVFWLWILSINRFSVTTWTIKTSPLHKP